MNTGTFYAVMAKEICSPL